jgi:Tol biopolymer transport system component
LFNANNLFDAGTIFNPRWSPNSQHIAFLSTADDPLSAYVMDVDGSNLKRFETGMFAEALVWSPDGRFIAYSNVLYWPRNYTQGIQILEVDTGEVFNLLRGVYAEADWRPC